MNPFTGLSVDEWASAVALTTNRLSRESRRPFFLSETGGGKRAMLLTQATLRAERNN